MTNRYRALRALFSLALVLGQGGGAFAEVESDVGIRYDAWRGCLRRSFGVQAVLTSRTLAADTALNACKPSESAYLAALSSSPLLDGDDVARVRPVLLQRVKGWLLGRMPSPTL